MAVSAHSRRAQRSHPMPAMLAFVSGIALVSLWSYVSTEVQRNRKDLNVPVGWHGDRLGPNWPFRMSILMYSSGQANLCPNFKRQKSTVLLSAYSRRSRVRIRLDPARASADFC